MSAPLAPPFCARVPSGYARPLRAAPATHASAGKPLLGKGCDGDLDICVVFSTLDRRPIEIMKELHAGLSAILKMPVDILVYDNQRFQERYAAGASFEQTVITEGIAV